MISRWAPPNENNTNAYVDAVARFMGVGAGEEIDLLSDHRNLLERMVQAITLHENGEQPYSSHAVYEGVSLA